MNRWENAVMRLGCAVLREIADTEDDAFALLAISRGVTVACDAAMVDLAAVRLRIGRAYGINGAIDPDDADALAGRIARDMANEIRKVYMLDKEREAVGCE